MDRRTYLMSATLGAVSLAGCADRSSTSDSPSTENGDSPRTEETLECTEKTLQSEPPFPTLHIQQDEIDNSNVSYEIGGCSPFSNSSPAEIEILISNDSHEDTKLEFSSRYPFKWETGIPKPYLENPIDSPSNLDAYAKDIASSQNLIPSSPDEGCWRASTTPQIDDTNEEQVILDPGESRAWKFVLLENATTSECLLEEEYIIENRSLPGNFKFKLELEY